MTSASIPWTPLEAIAVFRAPRSTKSMKIDLVRLGMNSRGRGFRLAEVHDDVKVGGVLFALASLVVLVALLLAIQRSGMPALGGQVRSSGQSGNRTASQGL